MNILITTPNALKAGGLPIGEDATVWFFGNSFRTFRELKASIEKNAFAPVGTLVNQEASLFARSYRNLDACLNIDASDRLGFDVTGIGARGRYDSDLFLNICRWSALKKALSAGGDHVVVVEQPELGLALFELASDYKPQTTILRKARPWHREIRHFVGGVLRHIKQRRILSRLRKEVPFDAHAFAEADVVLVMWARANSFPNAVQRDNWYGRLPGDLAGQGKKVAFWVMPVDWVDDFEAIAQNALSSGCPVLFSQECATLADVVSDVSASRHALKTLGTNLHIDGMDVSPLLRLAVYNEQPSWSSTDARLRARGADGLAQLDRCPPVLMHIYEGQAWEKALRHRVRGLLPEVKVVGLQHMPCPRYYFNFFPSDLEVSKGALPDHLFCIGDEAKERFSKAGFPSSRLSSGGALRFEDIINHEQGVPAETPTVLCCVGVDVDECWELVWKSAKAVARHPDVQLVVNYNPLADQEVKDAARQAVQDAMGDASSQQVRFSEERIAALVPQCAMVLYADTNAAYEAYAAGCQVIYIASTLGLDYDKLPDGWALHCNEPEEISEAIGRWLEAGATAVHPAERKDKIKHNLAPVEESRKYMSVMSEWI